MKKKKIKHNYQAVLKKGGCAVIDNVAKVPVPLYFFAYTANQSENVDAESAMLKIAGLMNLLEFENLENQMKETALGILKEYEHLKVKPNGTH
jgi:hypothetical protein